MELSASDAFVPYYVNIIIKCKHLNKCPSPSPTTVAFATTVTIVTTVTTIITATTLTE